MDEKKVRWTIGFLVLLVIVLAGLVIYVFEIKPAINGYTVNAQQEGINFAVSNIMSQIQEKGYAQIPIGNQTLFLTQFNPQQYPQQIQRSGNLTE